MSWRGGRVSALALCVAGSSGLAAPVRAQQPDTIPGVELGLLYDALHRPALALAPFVGAPGAESVATQAETIVWRDLELSDRFRVMESPPPALLDSERLDYLLWNRYSVDWLVRGRVVADGAAFRLDVQVHDVVYGRLLATRSVALPAPEHGDFRMAVHRASDAVVEAITGEPGIAATRVAFTMRAPGSETKDLYLVDSDGQSLRRVVRHDLSILSPTWHPEGRRLAFVSLHLDGSHGIYELDVRTGAERRLPPVGDGQHHSPAYLPDGRLAVTLDVGTRSRIVSWDPVRGCCVRALVESRWQELSPTFSPDGVRMAFTSNRLGAASPLVYVREVDGGDVELVAPFVLGESADFTEPAWSPLGDLLAYHGRIGRGSYQIIVTEVGEAAGRTRRLTSVGVNESPSWAPDGRHLVFVAQRPEGSGLFVVDVVTGRERRLLAAGVVSTPAWSPALARSASAP